MRKTAFEILLYRLTGARDFSIGIADGNRKDEETLACFGPIVNFVPTRYRVAPRAFGQELSDNRAKTYAVISVMARLLSCSSWPLTAGNPTTTILVRCLACQ